jgi:2-polyprenyl-3-methyl-5-hydroxy-6-metoxy-1,4-benzoquinol methylase
VTTDYDPIAEQYKRAKLQPWRTHVESFTLMNLLGDLSGKSVVDVACGDGTTRGGSALTGRPGFSASISRNG